MKDRSRRGFLAMAGTGAAVAGAAVAVPATAAAAAAPDTSVGDASGPLVVYIDDVRKGTLTVLVGEREVHLHDKELVARLTRATR
jgi:hypothetical protein